MIWLDAPLDLCLQRTTGRRYDPISSRVVNIDAVPSDLKNRDVSKWLIKSQDQKEVIVDRLKRSMNIKKELEKAYGYRKQESPNTGIMYDIVSTGLGEIEVDKDHPDFDRVLEVIEGSLLRPIPVEVRLI